MAWFTQDTLDFFAELEQNNNREWFEPNKKRYERSVKQPMKDLAAELIDRMREFHPNIAMKPSEAVSRIHRDTRFSPDKTPYKNRAYLRISAEGKNEMARPGLYFHVDAHMCAIASGVYMPDTAQVSAIRHAIAAEPDTFAALISDPGFVAKFGEVQGMRNKILPADLREAATTQPLIFNKQFFFWGQLESATILGDDLADVVMDHVRAGRPLNAFFEAALDRAAPNVEA